MKSILIVFGLLVSSSMALMAGACNNTMTLTQLSSLSSTGCEFDGYNFSNFNISGYIDLATTASNGYNFVVHNTPGDIATDNYLVTFIAAGSGFQVAFSGT